MKQSADELPTRIDAGGVKFQADDWSDVSVAHVCFPKDTDSRPLLADLPGAMCPVPHWGYVLKGSIHVHYADGREEHVKAGEAYYWPPGHSISTDEDYEAIEFSPAKPMDALLDHMAEKLRDD